MTGVTAPGAYRHQSEGRGPPRRQSPAHRRGRPEDYGGSCRSIALRNCARRREPHTADPSASSDLNRPAGVSSRTGLGGPGPTSPGGVDWGEVVAILEEAFRMIAPADWPPNLMTGEDCPGSARRVPTGRCFARLRRQGDSRARRGIEFRAQRRRAVRALQPEPSHGSELTHAIARPALRRGRQAC